MAIEKKNFLRSLFKEVWKAAAGEARGVIVNESAGIVKPFCCLLSLKITLSQRDKLTKTHPEKQGKQNLAKASEEKVN